MSDIIQKIGVPIVLLIVGLAVGRFAAPTKVEKVEVEKVVDRIVEKKVYVKVKEEKKETETTTTTIKKPDGTVITKTSTKEKSDNKTSEEDSKDSKNESIAESTNTTTIKRSKSKWHIQAIATYLEDQQLGYGGTVSMRISGPFFIGGFAMKDTVLEKDYYGISIGMEL